ncbi:uncharacterized protein LOC103869040 [Brassica rapa]|uniref:uncharacterized protein LOC103869040 n=1 Tax=Brassica campestris TaxID=3711 RepID=UPI00142E357A|nr:uncharacterized protein LOC103869040 [Brassica rapa]XP_033148191.1 uncharacterized protein LOC103869040 [Brassica rapa]
MKMCMFCGLYSWSLTHTLCNPNNKTSIVHSSRFGSEFIYGMFMLKDETKEKIVGESFIYMCYSHLYITI